MTPDQFASAALIVCCIAYPAISLAAYIIHILGHRDQAERQDFALVFCDLAGHQHWVATGADDWTPGETPVFEQLCVERWEHDLGDAS